MNTNSSNPATTPGVPAQAAPSPVVSPQTALFTVLQDPHEIIQLSADLREWFITFYVHESQHSTFSERTSNRHTFAFYALCEFLDSCLTNLLPEEK
ncbi:hypothetical protein GCM10027299_09520 [Larkinella ripae]